MIQITLKTDPLTDQGAIQKVLRERCFQDGKWGLQIHDMSRWLAILTEEIGEMAKAALENDPEEFKKEAIQVAAVAVAIVGSDVLVK